MPTLNFTTEQLQKFFSKTYFHKAYNETCKQANELRIHADGIYPQQLIEERRPSESKAVKDYRQKIWKPITKPVFSRILNSLNKIRRSSDWSVRFDTSKFPASIREGERLNDYCENNFPYFQSITNWCFNVLLRAYLIDANSYIALIPTREPVVAEDYILPFAYIFNSEQVIDVVDGDYIVLLSTDKVQYGDASAKAWGEVYYIITTQTIQRFEQIKSDRTMKLAWEYNHGLGELPAFKVKGEFKKSLDGTFIFDSRISSIIPRLDEALREYSDLQAEVVQHIHSDKWEFVTDDCPKCKGKGTINTAGIISELIQCPSCNGSGGKSRGPYTTLQVKAPMAGEVPLPTPPMGYVQKEISIVDIQDKRIDKHIYAALASINMQFLEDTPLNESGVAKEVDRDELNNFVHCIAEDLVANIDKTIYFINELRYSTIIQDKEQRKSWLPVIYVPEKFDILSSTYLEQELQNAKNNKLNPIIVNAIELDYANKKFNADLQVKEKVHLMLSLDPLAGVSEDDKMTRLSNNGINQTTYIISCNIQEFIAKAIEEKGDSFYSMDLKEQKELIKGYAIEQEKESTAAAKVLSSVTTG